MRWLIAILVMAIAVPVFAYHEFKVPKKAYRKVTIEHFSNEKAKTKPDSTVTIFYDKDGVEIHREFKKGCSNVIGGWGIEYIDSSSIWQPAIWNNDTLELHYKTKLRHYQGMGYGEIIDAPLTILPLH